MLFYCDVWWAAFRLCLLGYTICTVIICGTGPVSSSHCQTNILGQHSTINNMSENGGQCYTCAMCLFFTQESDNLQKHIIRIHKHDPRFRVVCNIGQCAFTTSSWPSFKNHMSKRHNNMTNDYDGDDGAVEDICPDNVEQENSNQCDEQHRRNQAIALSGAYLLRLETKHNLTEVAMRDVMEYADTLVKQYVVKAKDAIKQSLANEDHNYLIDATELTEPFSGLTTRHMRTKYYHENFGYIAPKDVILGRSLKRQKGHIKTVQDRGYYIPFLETIETLLSMPEVQHCVANPRVSNTSILRDICDGERFKEDIFFQENRGALQIIVYTDDLEVTNPLGTHTKKHKMTMFYFVIGNIYPEYRSKLSCIYLLALAKTCHIKKHGVKKLLADFISGINLLSTDGITISIGGRDTCIKGAVVLALADTPAAAWLGGFKEGVSFSHQPCRTCKITSAEMNTKFNDRDFHPRELDEYIEQCQSLDDPHLTKAAKRFWSKMWGVNKRSILCDLLHFNVCKCIVHDPMHIFLEGVIPYEMALFLNHAIYRKKWFKLSWLNGTIAAYPYRYNEGKDKPETIEKNHILNDVKLKQTSASMLTLCDVLPFIIGSYVPEDDTKWVNLIRLIEIMHMVTSPAVSDVTVNDLRYLIEVHHQVFRTEYVKSSFTPKMHYICHLPEQILAFGPSKYHMCMRFEAKHAFFTSVKWKNFRNLPKSMAEKHQKWICYEMLNPVVSAKSENYLYAGDEVKDGVEVPINDLCYGHKDILTQELAESDTQTVYSTQSITILGIEYRPHCVLHLGYDNDMFPVFAYLDAIYIHENEKLFVTKSVIICGLNKHINSYRIAVSDVCQIVHYKDLFVPMPLHARLYNHEPYICDKFSLVDTTLT